jgi:hypothetical protein
MNPSENGDITIAGKLVRFLRSGVKRELAASLEMLAFEVDKNVDPETYYGALARFDAARTLLDAIGVSDEPGQQDVELDLGRWPRLVLKALESQHDAELIRLEEVPAGELDLSTRDIPALGCLVESVRKKVGTPPRTRPSLPARHLPRRSRRTRGNGR